MTMISAFFFSSSLHPRDLHSFPTRRSSDLAIVINAARGEVLDVDAALDALTRNALGGLAIDVYDPEPPTRTWPDDPRLILTPHVAGCTTEAKSAIGAKLYEKIVAFYA